MFIEFSLVVVPAFHYGLSYPLFLQFSTDVESFPLVFPKSNYIIVTFILGRTASRIEGISSNIGMEPKVTWPMKQLKSPYLIFSSK